MFQESGSLLERYELARQAGFKAVECAFPYDYAPQEIAQAKTKAGVQQVLINSYPGIKEIQVRFCCKNIGSVTQAKFYKSQVIGKKVRGVWQLCLAKVQNSRQA